MQTFVFNDMPAIPTKEPEKEAQTGGIDFATSSYHDFVNWIEKISIV